MGILAANRTQNVGSCCAARAYQGIEEYTCSKRCATYWSLRSHASRSSADLEGTSASLGREVVESLIGDLLARVAHLEAARFEILSNVTDLRHKVGQHGGGGVAGPSALRLVFAGRCRRLLDTLGPHKATFSRAIEPGERRSVSWLKHGERDIWQRRFWEHCIRDDADHARHVDYVYWNPVKHGHVGRVVERPYSSYYRHVARGFYSSDWGWRPRRACRCRVKSLSRSM